VDEKIDNHRRHQIFEQASDAYGKAKAQMHCCSDETDENQAKDALKFIGTITAELQSISLHPNLRLFAGLGLSQDNTAWFYALGTASHWDRLDKLVWRKHEGRLPKPKGNAPHWAQRLQWLEDVAAALEHMNTHGFVHARVSSPAVSVSHDDLVASSKRGKQLGQQPQHLRRARLGEPLAVTYLCGGISSVHIDNDNAFIEIAKNGEDMGGAYSGAGAEFLWHAPELLPSLQELTAALRESSGDLPKSRRGDVNHSQPPKESKHVLAQHRWKNMLAKVGRSGRSDQRAGVLGARSGPQWSHKSDIFALGVLGQELMALAAPWDYRIHLERTRTTRLGIGAKAARDMKRRSFRAEVMRRVLSGERMDISSSTNSNGPPKLLSRLIRRCLRQRRQARPRAARMVRELRAMRLLMDEQVLSRKISDEAHSKEVLEDIESISECNCDMSVSL